MQALLRIVVISLGLLVPFAAAQEAGNDFLLLKDGRVIVGKKLTRAEGGLKLTFKNGEVFVPQELIEDCLIAGELLAPASEEEKAQIAKGNVRFEGKWMSVKQRDALIAKRNKERTDAFKALEARKEWRNRAKQATKHFAFEYTLPDKVFDNYRDLMETYFETFIKDWKISLPRDLGPLLVCLHIDYDAMIQIGGAGQGVLGYFKFIEPMELNFYHDRLDPEFTQEVMFHETNHYLQKLIDLDFSMPHFPGESLAEFYGASKWDPVKKKLSTGLILEGRLCEVQSDIDSGNWRKLSELVSTDGDYDHYTWGWSLVHFLMSTPAYSKKFREFVNALPAGKDVKREGSQVGSEYLKTVEGKEVWRVFQKYLGLEKPEQVEALQGEWYAYIKSNLKLVSARGFEEAARNASGMYPPRPIKAKRLFQTAIEMGSKNPQTYYRYGKLLLEDGGEVDKGIEMLRKAIELDPLNGSYYGELGRALGRKGQKDEAKRLRQLGAEIDPDDPWITILGLEDD